MQKLSIFQMISDLYSFSSQDSIQRLFSKIIFLTLLSATINFQVSAQGNADAEVISYVKNIEVEEDELSSEEEILLQINNRMGERYSEFVLHYSKIDYIKSLKVTIEDVNGKIIRKIKGSEIKSVSAVDRSMLYSDDFVYYFQPKHNRYPYRIRVNYERKSKEFLWVAHWVPVKSYKIPTHNASLTISTKEGYEIQYQQRHLNPPHINIEDGIKKYTWKGTYDADLKRETFCPAYTSLLPGVEVYPNNFNYGVRGSINSWKSFGQWTYDLNANLLELTFQEKQEIDRLLDNLPHQSEREIIRSLYNYLQHNTRYINVSIEIGGFKSYPAEYVCTNKYGDCKALSTYMIALLKHAGIDAYRALVNSAEPAPEINVNSPAQEFNHVVVQVPLRNDTLWLECTSKFLPYNYIHSQLQNRYALVIKNNNSYLTKIKPWNASDYVSEIEMEYRLNLNGDADVSSKIKAKGYDYEFFNQLNQGATSNEKEQSIPDILAIPRHDLLNWSFMNTPEDSAYTILKSIYKAFNFMESYGNSRMVKIPAIDLPDFELPRKRQLGIQIDYPVAKKELFRFTIPPSIEVVNIPESTSLKSDFGEYDLICNVENNTIILERNYTLYPTNLSVDKYTSYFAFISEIYEIERSNVVILD